MFNCNVLVIFTTRELSLKYYEGTWTLTMWNALRWGFVRTVWCELGTEIRAPGYQTNIEAL